MGRKTLNSLLNWNVTDDNMSIHSHNSNSNFTFEIDYETFFTLMEKNQIKSPIEDTIFR